VRYSAEDAQAQRFETLVVEDACRAIDMGGTAVATRDSLAGHGIALITSNDV
jgi:nicotinamidase/pyrazinamidase